MNANINLFVLYVCLTIYMLTRSRRIYSKPDTTAYVDKVHSHMASIMFVHVLVATMVLITKPKFMDKTYVIVMNTIFSILFSILYYRTPEEEPRKQYSYIAMYLIFASILFADGLMYFSNSTYVWSFITIYAIFLYDTHFYEKTHRKQIIFGYMITNAILAMLLAYFNNNFEWLISFMFMTVYATLVVGYMYYDHDTLYETPRDTPLNMALKYFLDVEGTIVRMSKEYVNKDDE